MRFLAVAAVAALLTGCTSPQADDAEVEVAEVEVPKVDTTLATPLDSVSTPHTIPNDLAAPSATPREGTAEEELRDATNALQAYYAAINAGAFDRAYMLWSDSGRASGQTLDAFRDGYSQTAEVEVRAGEGTIEGAVGSRYAEIPVVIEATSRDGARQRFEGSYVLRRSVVDGATLEQRSWRIYSADIRETR